MSLNDTMKEHMDAVRKVTGFAQQLSLNESTGALLAGDNEGVMYKQTLDLTNSKYDSDTWYPVQAKDGYRVAGFDRIRVQRSLDDRGGAPWGTHPTSGGHGFCVYNEAMMNHSGWAAFPTHVYHLVNEHGFDDGKSPVHIDELIENAGYLLWLRGGAFYDVYVNNTALKFEVHDDKVETATQSCSPTKIEPEDFALANAQNMLRYLDLSTLGERLNKLGGVIKSLLYAVRQHFSLSLIGGVA